MGRVQGMRHEEARYRHHGQPDHPAGRFEHQDDHQGAHGHVGVGDIPLTHEERLEIEQGVDLHEEAESGEGEVGGEPHHPACVARIARHDDRIKRRVPAERAQEEREHQHHHQVGGAEGSRFRSSEQRAKEVEQRQRDAERRHRAGDRPGKVDARESERLFKK